MTLLPSVSDLFIHSLSASLLLFNSLLAVVSPQLFTSLCFMLVEVHGTDSREQTSADGLILPEWNLTQLQSDYLPFMSI